MVTFNPSLGLLVFCTPLLYDHGLTVFVARAPLYGLELAH